MKMFHGTRKKINFLQRPTATKEMFLTCEGNWLRSSVVKNSRQYNNTRRFGKHIWLRFMDLVEKHGAAIAEDIRKNKHEAGASWHKPHPDLPTSEAWGDEKGYSVCPTQANLSSNWLVFANALLH